MSGGEVRDITGFRRAIFVTAALAAALTTAGCHDDVTEVVLVMKGDLLIPTDVTNITVSSQLGLFEPQPFGSNVQLSSFPLSYGFVSPSGSNDLFSVTVQLSRSVPPGFLTQPVVTRKIIGLRFVPEQTRMLVLPMLAACACHGTSCPNPGTNPDCDDLMRPETQPFDPTMAPPPSDNPWGPSFGRPL